LDKLDRSVKEFKRSNRHQFTLPFSWFIRNRAHADPMDGAARLRGYRQEPKK